jgi:hypothetical protein
MGLAAPQAIDFERLVVGWTCLGEHPEATLQTKHAIMQTSY